MAIQSNPIRIRTTECRGQLENLLVQRRQLIVEMATLDERIELARMDLIVTAQHEMEIPLPQPAKGNAQQLLRATEAADMLQISKTAVYDLHKSGRLPSVRPTGERGALRFRVEDVQRYARDPEAFIAPSPIPAVFRRRRRRA